MDGFFPVLCFFLIFARAGAFFGHGLLRCKYNTTQDVTYLEQFFFNKFFFIEYNSTVGKYTGFSKRAQEICDELNKSQILLDQAKKNKEACEANRHIVYNVLSKPVEPTVRLISVEAASSTHPGLFMCSAYNFYPKRIKLTWLKNGETVTSDVTSTDELPNGNWLYQIHSQLEFTPTSEEKISCMVEHASLILPKIYDYDPWQTSKKNKVAAGSAGLVLGAVFATAGLIVYLMRNRTHGHHEVPTS